MSPPPPTLAIGTLSPPQNRSEQCVQGPSMANVKATHSSKFCKQNRPSEHTLSSCMRLTLPIAQVIDLWRKNQSVNARKRKGASGQTARRGREGARAGSPSAIGRPGRRRQPSARQNQTYGLIRRPPERQRAPFAAITKPSQRKGCINAVYCITFIQYSIQLKRCIKRYTAPAHGPASTV